MYGLGLVCITPYETDILSLCVNLLKQTLMVTGSGSLSWPIIRSSSISSCSWMC